MSFSLNCYDKTPLPRHLTDSKDLLFLEPSDQGTNTTASGEGSFLGRTHMTSCCVLT